MASHDFSFSFSSRQTHSAAINVRSTIGATVTKYYDGQHCLVESLEIKSEGYAYGLLVPKYLAHVEIASGDMCYWLPTTGDVC